MADVVVLMLPIFATIAIGVVFVHLDWFPKEGLPFLNQFVAVACVPVILFSAIANGESLATFAWSNALVFGLSSLVAVGLLWIVLRVLLGQPQAQSLILAMGAGTANSVYLGFPIAAVLIPDRAEATFAWVVFAEIAIILPVMVGLASISDGSESGNPLSKVALRLFLNPVSLGLIVGFFYLASGWQYPGWVQKVENSIVAAGP